MHTGITRLLFAVFCILLKASLSAQPIYVGVEPIEHFDPYFEKTAVEIEDFVTRLLVINQNVRVVERTDFSGIATEQERQKNEAFIDGDVVEQGKLIGARIIVRFQYDEDASNLRLQVVDVSSGDIFFSENYSMEKEAGGKLPQDIWDRMGGGLQTCFRQFGSANFVPLQVVELLGGQDGSARLLVYAEDMRSIKIGAELSIYVLGKKKVGSKDVDYTEVIGSMRVEEIENKNFLNGKILKGVSEIQLKLTSDNELYAKPSN